MREKKRVKSIYIILLVLLVMIIGSGCSKNKVSISETDQAEYCKIGGTDSGYYFLKDSGMGQLIYFFDKESKQTIPLCNKGNCTHNSEECDAFFLRPSPESVAIDVTLSCGIRYYDEGLYVLDDGKTGIELIRISTDGTKREFVCTISENRKAHIAQFCINKGMVYFAEDIYKLGDCASRLYVKDINSNETSRCIFEKTSDESVNIFEVQGYEEGVYFLLWVAEEDANNGFELYLISDDVAEPIIQGHNIRRYVVDENYIYFICFDGSVHKYDKASGQDEIIYNTGSDLAYYMEMDSNYIYLDNGFGRMRKFFLENESIEPELRVLDFDGNLINSINLKDYADILTNDMEYQELVGVDDDYLIYNLSMSGYILVERNMNPLEIEIIELGGYE